MDFVLKFGKQRGECSKPFSNTSVLYYKLFYAGI